MSSPGPRDHSNQILRLCLKTTGRAAGKYANCVDTQIIHQDIKREELCINKDAAPCNQINNKLLGLGSIASVHNLSSIKKAKKATIDAGCLANVAA